ncbi:MAG: hypothetical protein RMI49_03030 [Candidatus Caldarchaeum sp.]|nr:hypothetical protein [Candidatus Caldarchaeum sp.]
MNLLNHVIRGVYRDSVQLMEVTERIKRIKGVADAAVVMGTQANKESLKPLGLLIEEGERAGPNDIIIALKTTASPEEVLAEAKRILFEVRAPAARYLSLEDALRANPDITYASISIPGKYVEEVAFKLLDKGVHLFVFSDHVPVETEIALKKRAAERNLLVMGPEAGTAIVSGVGFGFANNVSRGNVGVVASAGSGIQEFVTLLDHYGIGVSHAIGVGARDLTKQVGGIMTRKALQALDDDDQTKIITLIAKQSDIEIVKEILETEKISKPLMLSLLGHPDQIMDYPQAPTLHGLAVRVASAVSAQKREEVLKTLEKEVEKLKGLVGDGGGYPRGFYSGGTLATETAYIWTRAGLTVYTNLNTPWTRKIANPYTSMQATIIDYGSEEFTEGRPHPIIDPTLRNRRVASELSQSETNSVVMDLIIGYGAPDNIVEKTFEQIGEAIVKNRDKKTVLRLVGTRKDSQWEQTKLLEQYGVVSTHSNALAAAFTAACSLGESFVLEKLVDEHIVGGLA